MLPLFAYSPNEASQDCWRQIGDRIGGARLSVGDRLDHCLEEKNTCEAVIISRPSAPPVSDVEKLIRGGKHVLFVDYPSWQLDEMLSLWHLADQSGVQLKVVNSNRYQPSRQLIKRQITSHLGPPGLLRSYRWEPAAKELPPPVAGLPAGLIDDLDLALWLFERPVERVYAVEHKLPDGAKSAGRYLQLHLGFAQGMALIDYTNRLPADEPYQSLSVIGFSGAAYAEDDENKQLAFRDGRAQALSTASRPVLAMTGIVQEFVDGLAAGHDLSPSVTSLQQVFALADAVNQSLATHHAIAGEGG